MFVLLYLDELSEGFLQSNFFLLLVLKYPNIFHKSSTGTSRPVPQPTAHTVMRIATEDNVPIRFELFLLGDDEKKVTEIPDTRKLPQHSFLTEFHSWLNLLRYTIGFSLHFQ